MSRTWWLPALAILALCGCPLQGAPQVVVIYADDSFPSYSFLDNCRLAGIYTQIV